MKSNKGGMQSAGLGSLYCRCGLETSKKLVFLDEKEVSVHFTQKSTYWHIYKKGRIKRTFKQPACWGK